MTLWHVYIGIENLGLNNEQRGILVEALRRLGQKEGGLPHERMQPYPVRLDGQAAIFEAVFDDSALTIAV